MATYSTVAQIVSRLIRLSGQVPGTGVQVYSTDVFVDMINTAVRMLGRRYWWPHFMDWKIVETTVGTGVPTADIGIQDHTDIKAVFAGNCEDPLPYISDNINPQRYIGSRALAYEALPISNPLYSGRVIRVVPFESQDTLRLRVRVMPQELSLNDIVPLDSDMVVFAVLWSYFEDEGDNPQQAGKYKQLLDAKFSELVSAQSTHRVALEDGNRDNGEWRTGSDVISLEDLTEEY